MELLGAGKQSERTQDALDRCWHRLVNRPLGIEEIIIAIVPTNIAFIPNFVCYPVSKLHGRMVGYSDFLHGRHVKAGLLAGKETHL